MHQKTIVCIQISVFHIQKLYVQVEILLHFNKILFCLTSDCD